MDYDGYTDEELIEKLRQGEEDIMDYILEKYKPLVRKRTNAMYLIGGENEDLIQEGMIGLFKAIRDYHSDRDSSFFHFAQLCINCQLYTALEASNRKKHMPLNSYVSLSGGEGDETFSVSEEVLGRNRSPEQMVIEQEVLDEFTGKLKKRLSPLERQVLSLYLEGSNYVQIAKILHKPPKSVDNALQRIRQKIRQLKEEP